MVVAAQDYIAAGDITKSACPTPLMAAVPSRHGLSTRRFGYSHRALFCISRPWCSGSIGLARNVSSDSAAGGLSPAIKGTRPRRADAQLDQRNAYDLITSTKEIAELVMITDLERNDLGRVCEYGSVTVPELLKLESYEQVHHLVSTVMGHCRKM